MCGMYLQGGALRHISSCGDMCKALSHALWKSCQHCPAQQQSIHEAKEDADSPLLCQLAANGSGTHQYCMQLLGVFTTSMPSLDSHLAVMHVLLCYVHVYVQRGGLAALVGHAKVLPLPKSPPLQEMPDHGDSTTSCKQQ